MRHLAVAIFAAACLWPSLALPQAPKAAKAMATSKLVLGLQLRGGSSEERITVLLKTAELVRRRLKDEGVANANVVPVGEDRLVVMAPAGATLEKVGSQLTALPKLSFRLLDNKGSAREALAGNVPPGDEVLWAVDDAGRDARRLLVQRQEWLTGKDILRAEGAYNNAAGFSAVVNVQFDAAGKEVLAQVTSGNSGRKLVIVWLDKIIGLTIIDRPVLDGILPVYSSNSDEAVQELATILNMSAMVSSLSVIEDHSEVQPLATAPGK